MAKGKGLQRLTEEEKATVEANMGLVYAIASRMPKRRLTRDDRVQAGTLGLMRAVQLFDPTLGFQLSTYAHKWIKQYIQRAEYADATIRIPHWVLDSGRAQSSRPVVKAMKASAEVCRSVVSLDAFPGDAASPTVSNDPAVAMEARDETAKAKACLDVLDEKRRDVLIGRFWDGETLKQIGRRYGVTSEWIRQWERLALLKIRATMDPELAKGA